MVQVPSPPVAASAEFVANRKLLLAHPTRFERVTFAFGGQRSIQLSYGCVAVHLADWRGLGNGPAGAGLARSKGPLRLLRRTAFWSVGGQLRLAGKSYLFGIEPLPPS